MKTGFILCFTLVWMSFNKVAKVVHSHSGKWVVSKNSSLVVNGRTNLNAFSCAIREYPKTDTVICSDKEGSLLLSGQLNIEVKNFDCKNLLMTKQLKKTLRAEEFPNIQVRLLSLKENPVAIQEARAVKGLIELTIAGTTRRLEINYQLTREKSALCFKGYQSINFSNFNLEPPKKMGQLIQAKDQLGVLFLLKMEEVL